MKKIFMAFALAATYLTASAQTQVGYGDDRNFIPGEELIKKCVCISYSVGEPSIVKFFISFSEKSGFVNKAVDKNMSALYGMEKHKYLYFKLTANASPVKLKKGKCYRIVQKTPTHWEIELITCRK